MGMTALRFSTGSCGKHLNHRKIPINIKIMKEIDR